MVILNYNISQYYFLLYLTAFYPITEESFICSDSLDSLVFIILRSALIEASLWPQASSLHVEVPHNTSPLPVHELRGQSESVSICVVVHG